MDGTLLNSRHEVSEHTRNVIKKAHDLGVHIIITTGRLYANAEAYSNYIGVKSPVIASNGAVIRGIERDEIIYKSIFDEKLCVKLLNIFDQYNAKPAFNTPDRVYIQSLKLKLFLKFIKLHGRLNKTFKISYVPTKRYWFRIFSKETNNIVKCELIDKDSEKLRNIREELLDIEDIEIVSSSGHNIEITKKGVSKGGAVASLAEYYNIKREEIMAIGDSENDLSMIEFAGTGIAMGNAIEKVKEKACYITDTNDNDGVAKAISKFVLDEN